MANLVLTSGTNKINVAFNDLASVSGIKKGVWHKERVTFQLMPSDSYIKVLVIGEVSWAVSYNGSSGTLQIDTVAGVTPSSNSDLYDKLDALL